MHFDLILGDDDNQTTKVECHIELTAFDVGYHITPCVTRFNCYQSKNNQWDIVLNKLTMLIDAWDELQLDSNNIVMQRVLEPEKKQVSLRMKNHLQLKRS